MLVFGEAKSLEGALAVLIPFALPSVGVIAFLMFTEADYRKAWVLKEAEKHSAWAKNFGASGNAQTFGMMTAALWILAIGAFVFLLIIKLWIFSWIPLVVALALMMLLLAHYMKNSL
jgi:phosphatidylglycerophosphatase A